MQLRHLRLKIFLTLTLLAPILQNGQTHSNNSSTNCLSVFDHFAGLALKGLRFWGFGGSFSYKKNRVGFGVFEAHFLIKRNVYWYFLTSLLVIEMSKLEDTYSERARSNKTPTLTKWMNMDNRVAGTSNQLFIRGSFTETKFSKESSSYW